MIFQGAECDVADAADDGVRKRKGNATQSKEHGKATKMVTFEVERRGAVQTDASADGGFQKAVKLTKDTSLMATAGADGYLRVWKVE